MRQVRNSRERGLTFIELLVAASIGLIILTLVLQLTLSSKRITDWTMAEADSTEGLQIVMALIGDDVRQASFVQPSLDAPSWVSPAATASTDAITLRLPTSTATCAATPHDVAYYFVKRSDLTATSIDAWLRLPGDARNTDQLALLRARRCGTAVTARLVADYLIDPDFAVASLDSTVYVSDHAQAVSLATGGASFRSVRLSMASQINLNGRTVRTPRAGTVTSTATTRTIDLPLP